MRRQPYTRVARATNMLASQQPHVHSDPARHRHALPLTPLELAVQLSVDPSTPADQLELLNQIISINTSK